MRRPFWQWAHYDCMQWYLRNLFREATRVLRLRIVTVGPTPEAFPGDPLLVLSRHAGPGDSFTIVNALMNTYDREPRIVLKNTLMWEPTIGILMHRLPNRFVRPDPRPGQDLRSQIADLARGLDSDDALLIFPEGGNFTPGRRTRAIARLRHLGLEQMAVRTEMDPCAGPATRWGRGGARCRARSRRASLRAHRPGPPRDRRRHLARTADGQGAHPALVACTRAHIPSDPDGISEWLFEEWARIDA